MSVMTFTSRVVWCGLVGVLLGGLLGVAAAGLGPAAPAAAHANLVGSEPASGTVLSDPPDRVVLSFSEPVRLIPERIVVVGPDGELRELADQPTTDGGDVIVPVEESLDIGTYLVSYRVVSRDSHPVFGSITYSVGAPSEVPTVPAGQTEVGDPVVGAAVSVNKYVGYAGLVFAVGPAVALALLWPRRLSRRGVTRLLWVGLGLVALSTVAGPWLQAAYSTGDSLVDTTAADLQEVLNSPFGTAHAVRLGVLVAVAVLVLPLISGQAGRWDRVLLTGLAVIGLGTWPVAGHPIASPLPLVSVLAGTVHVAAAAIWLGGLVVLAGFLLRRANQRELTAILPEWSRWAAVAVAALLLAGLVQAVVEIGPPEALVQTTYGRLLLVKLGLVAVVIAVAGYSRKLVRTRLGPSRPMAMRAAVATEAVVLAAVLAMSSVLVQATPGRTEAAAVDGGGAAATGDFATTLTTELYSLQFLLEPAEQGSNMIHLYAYSPEGDPQPVQEWRATAALPAAEIAPTEITLLDLTDNHAFGEVTLPVAGEWEFEFTLRVSETDQESVGVTVPIR